MGEGGMYDRVRYFIFKYQNYFSSISHSPSVIVTDPIETKLLSYYFIFFLCYSSIKSYTSFPLLLILTTLILLILLLIKRPNLAHRFPHLSKINIIMRSFS